MALPFNTAGPATVSIDAKKYQPTILSLLPRVGGRIVCKAKVVGVL